MEKCAPKFCFWSHQHGMCFSLEAVLEWLVCVSDVAKEMRLFLLREQRRHDAMHRSVPPSLYMFVMSASRHAHRVEDENVPRSRTPAVGVNERRGIWLYNIRLFR